MHDANGTELRVGDKVNIPCTITAIHPGADYCNMQAESDLERRPDHDHERFTINSGVVRLVSRLQVVPGGSGAAK